MADGALAPTRRLDRGAVLRAVQRARARLRPHVPFAHLVAHADGARPADADRVERHVAVCARCAAAMREITRVTASVRPTAASASETASAVATARARLVRTLARTEHAPVAHPDRAADDAPFRTGERFPAPVVGADGEVPALLATAAGERVAGALAPWLGQTAARALLQHVRAGERACRDVLHAVAHPLTSFLGEDAGRALAVRVSRLADAWPEDADPSGGRASPCADAAGSPGTGP